MASSSTLNQQILIGVLLGIALGLVTQMFSGHDEARSAALWFAGLVGGVFIDLLKMVLVPLVFCSIVTGIANLRQHQHPERVWKLTLGFFILSMALAIAIGFSASHLVQPGHGQSLSLFQDKLTHATPQSLTFLDFISQFLHSLFMNPFAALSQGNILAIVCFALITGTVLSIRRHQFSQLLSLVEDGLQLSLTIVHGVMYLAPFGIAALLFKLVATQDAQLFTSLLTFVLMVVGSTLLHGIVVLPGLLWLVTRLSPIAFWRGARPALVTAFATSSSAATMPVTLNTMTQALHVKPEIAGFVIPLGATLNMDGTALYEAAAALFIANLAGVDLTMAQQMVVFFMSMIAAMGAPGIPSAGMVTMVMVLQSVGLPAEAIAILLPIDRLLDTLRTTVNVEGDMVGSLIVQKLTAEK